MIIFYKINNHFSYFDPDYLNEQMDGSFFKHKLINKRSLSSFSDKDYMRGDNINNLIGLDLFEKEKYYLFCVKRGRQSYVICGEIGIFGLKYLRKRNNDKFYRIVLTKGVFHINKLINYNKGLLIDNLISKNADIYESISIFQDYCNFDGYVFWLYNSHTDYFSLESANLEISKKYINKEDNSSLHEFVLSKSTYDRRSPHDNCVNAKASLGMETINRVRVDFGRTSEVGIIDFFSKTEGYYLRDDTREIIKNHIESKYFERQIQLDLSLHKIEEYFSGYTPGKLYSFLNGLTKVISEELHFEACSIFEKVKDKRALRLVAQKSLAPPLDKDFEPYDLSGDSLTAQVFNGGSWLFSYDIENDPRNTRTYSETTESLTGKAWIGFPLILPTEKGKIKWGVLRVKNKFKENNGYELINFTTNDYFVLSSVCTHLSNIYNLETNHKSSQLRLEELSEKERKLEKSLEELSNFYNVFLHEIRTPISTFNTSPLRINSLLKKIKGGGKIKAQISTKVNDIKIMAGRLKFIADTYYFDELVKSRKPEFCSVLSEIIMPVLSISRDFIAKQYNVSINYDPSSFHSYVVYGDQLLLNLVFNTLINNAAKYSVGSGKPIYVGAEIDKNKDYLYLSVSNYGLNIHPAERERIFGNLERGESAIANGIGGTGIGLHLARNIMKNQSGDVILTSLKAPVTFKMKIPMKKWEASND